MGWLGELNLWLAMGRDPDCFLDQRLVVANRDSEVLDMLPLTLANIGEEQMIHNRKIWYHTRFYYDEFMPHFFD